MKLHFYSERRKRMKKIINSRVIGVTGHKGRLGSELVLAGCIPLECDVNNKHSVLRTMDHVKPDVVIHCASVTDVNEAETTRFKEASRVNIAGTAVVRDSFSGQMIYMSTDYIYDGKKGPYKEGAAASPICHYGYTKWMGEEIVKDYAFPRDVIVRTTILYGDDSPKLNFVTAVLKKLEAGRKFEVTTGLSGTPTYIPHLVEALLELVKIETPTRVLNIVGSTVLTRYEFALMIAGILKWEKAKRLGLPIYPVVEGLVAMKERMDAN
jgi:dTDP-4-dehydrorhamnose reductase